MSAHGGTLVIGAAQGIGEATARKLAKQDWAGRLVLSDIKANQVEGVAASLRAAGANAVAIPVDLADPASIDRLVAEAGPIDRLALVAGILNRHPALEMTTDIFERVMKVNCIGVYLAAQAFARRMIEREVRGAIVAVTSAGGRRPKPNLAAYCASKGAVAMALKVLALETMPKGVRINMVAPTATLTPMSSSGADSGPASRASLRGKVNMPEDIAAAVSFLLSPDSEAIGLRELVVDGGTLLGL